MYSKAYRDFLVFFHGSRDYFECHEVLEEFWKEDCLQGKQSVWVGLILVSVALYHQRIKNFNGSYRSLKKAIVILQNKKEKLHQLGIDENKFIQLLTERLAEIKEEQAYYSINIPITDQNLLASCIDCCKQMGFEWNQPSDVSNLNLIYKHCLRDRSSIIEERTKQLLVRKKRRPNS